MFDGLDTSVRAIFVAPGDLVPWAPSVRPHIEKMAQRSGGRYEAPDIFAELAVGKMLLWVAVEGTEIRCVLVGQIMEYPRKRALRLSGIVGNHPRKWMHLLPLIEDQARQKFGCVMIESLHQPRHIRLLPGFTTSHWLSEKPL